jgi:hypothetical protein
MENTGREIIEAIKIVFFITVHVSLSVADSATGANC